VRVSQMVREDLKVLWKVIAHSWEGRPVTYDRVSKAELFMLWSMDTGNSVNMSAICMNLLVAQQQESARAIFIGPLVTRLCISLGNQMKMNWFEHRLPGAHIVPLSPEDVAKLHLRQLVRTRVDEEMADDHANTPMTSPGFTPSPMSFNSPSLLEMYSPLDSSMYSPPPREPGPSVPPSQPEEQNPNFSTFNIPNRFTPVTDWRSLQNFQYQLYLEQMQKLDEISREIKEIKKA